MLFNSLQFLIFLPLVVVLYYALPFRFRWVLIFVASCYFYMAFVPKYILILFLIILIDYALGIVIERSQGKRRTGYLVLSLSSNILLLCFFKYYNFLSDNLSGAMSVAGYDLHLPKLDVLLPIGLSFHTFQSMAYIMEVYRGKQKAERHLGYFANYVLFFPQMVAGPIERYDTLGNELRAEHAPRYQNFSDGFKLILYGLFAKMVVADNLAPYVNAVYADPGHYNSVEVLGAIFLFSFQIYADFSGYSTIALGCARLLGITIMDNFKTPYLSRSFSEFWSRWHISLSTWFRDYLYIPLGGNRVNLTRWVFNIMVVFMVSGLWHGASWTFVVWGALHGIMLVSERFFSRLTGFKGGQEWSVWTVLMTVKTFILTSLIWVFFRAEDFGKAKQVFAALFNNQAVTQSATQYLVPCLAVAVFFLFDLVFYDSRADRRLGHLQPVLRWTVYAALIYGLFAFSGTQKFAFIYFQF